MTQEELNKIWLEGARSNHEAWKDPKNTSGSYLAQVPLGVTGLTPPIMNLDQWEELGNIVKNLQNDPVGKYSEYRDKLEKNLRTSETTISDDLVVKFIFDALKRERAWQDHNFGELGYIQALDRKMEEMVKTKSSSLTRILTYQQLNSLEGDGKYEEQP